MKGNLKKLRLHRDTQLMATLVTAEMNLFVGVQEWQCSCVPIHKCPPLITFRFLRTFKEKIMALLWMGRKAMFGRDNTFSHTY